MSMVENSTDNRLPTQGEDELSWSRYLPSLAAILLVTWPLLSYGIIDNERARWQHAAARIAWNEGDQEAALQVLNRAVELDPENIAALIDRAQWLGELGDYENSSQDLQAATGLAGSVRQEIQLRQQLCDSLLHLQEADAVIQQWDLMQQAVDSGGGRGNWSLEQQVLWLNNRAYQVAVSGRQPAFAVEEANHAIALLGGEGIAWDYNGAPLYLAACQAYLQQSYSRALGLSTKAVRNASIFLESWKKQFEPGLNWKASEQRRREKQLETMRRYVASLYKLQSLVLEKTGQHGKQREALKEIEQLGQDFHQLEAVIGQAEEIRSLAFSPGRTDLRSTLLDTRGFAYLKNQQPNLALMDLEVAVRICDAQYHRLIVSVNRQRSLVVDPGPLDRLVVQMTRQLAVVLYHRSLVYDALHRPARAREDRERIKRLGFTPDRHLF